MTRWRARWTEQFFMAALTFSLSAPSAAQDCREAKTRIVGGKETRIAQWPGQATLRSTTKGGKSALYFCGGTAISDRWVLTGIASRAPRLVQRIEGSLRPKYPTVGQR